VKRVEQLSNAVCLWVCVVLTVAGCGLGAGPTVTPVPTPTPNLLPADEVAFAFLQAWESSDYPVMYSLLSPAAQLKYGEEQFTITYQQVVDEAVLLNITPNIQAAYQSGAHADISFNTSFGSALTGNFEVQNQMALSYVEGRWGIDWSPALIFPQLGDDTFVHMTSRVPARGNIYDRNGMGLAVQGEQVEIGVIPGKIQDEANLLWQLSQILGRPIADLQAKYAGAGADWYVPLGQVDAATGQAYYETLTSMPGVELRAAWTRSSRRRHRRPHSPGRAGSMARPGLHRRRDGGPDGVGNVGGALPFW
jgi:NTF2-like N-terminal transpeptidase domain/Penicillin-binding Protein dimerisation domain